MDAVIGATGVGANPDNVVLAKRGDKAAFERLFRQHSVSLYRVARGILQPESDIEDAIQETVLKAYQGIGNLRNVQFFKTWLIKILINECNNILRVSKRTVSLVEMEPATEDNQYDNLELFSVVQSLDYDLRIVTLLFYYEDLSQKDIAEILGIPTGTVSSRLSRSREKLRAALLT